MNSNYTTLAIFQYSTEAHLLKATLEAANINVILVDEVTVDADPLISQAIGGVKLRVHKDDLFRANEIYNTTRRYALTTNGSPIHCPACNATQILIAPLHRKNLFYMLFPFFEKKRHICTKCKTIF